MLLIFNSICILCQLLSVTTVHCKSSHVISTQDLHTNYDRIVAIGDIHGSFTQMMAILQEAKICDRQYNWIANRTILIHIGDIMDRGPHSIAVIQQLIHWQEEASQFNSLCIGVLGMDSDELRRIFAPTTTDFLNFYNNDTALNAVLRNFYDQLEPGTRLGGYLRTLPVIRVIGEYVFVHAGITPSFLLYFYNNIGLINTVFMHYLSRTSITVNGSGSGIPLSVIEVLATPDGPVWTREFDMVQHIGSDSGPSGIWMKKNGIHHHYDGGLSSECRDVQIVLDRISEQINQKVSKMIIGHNVNKNRIISVCDDALIGIDVGMYLDGFGALIIEKNRLFAIEDAMEMMDVDLDIDEGKPQNDSSNEYYITGEFW
eukprot:92688_1